MASIVGIANRAIQKVGAQRILSLDANTREARAVNNCYDAVRQALLRRYRWKFAKKRVLLAADSAKPAYGYAFQVSLPADCLRPLLPEGESCDDRRVEGRKILTSYSDSGTGFLLALDYISDVTDPNLMDPSFRECFAQKIAIEISDELTQSVTRKANLKEEWKEVYAEAAGADSFEDPPIDAPTDTWITARLGGFEMGGRHFVASTTPAPSPAPVPVAISGLYLGLSPIFFGTTPIYLTPSALLLGELELFLAQDLLSLAGA